MVRTKEINGKDFSDVIPLTFGDNAKIENFSKEGFLVIIGENSYPKRLDHPNSISMHLGGDGTKGSGIMFSINVDKDNDLYYQIAIALTLSEESQNLSINYVKSYKGMPDIDKILINFDMI